jgi:hypothetical protein
VSLCDSLGVMGIVPFISYSYKVLPVLSRAILETPHRAMGILAGFGLINQIVYDHEFEDPKAMEKFEREMQPDYQKSRVYGVGPVGTVRMPTKDGTDEGALEPRSVFVDYMRMMPGGDLLDPAGIFGSFPFGTHPSVTIMAALAFGEDPVFHKELDKWEHAETDSQKWDNRIERLKFIERTLLPNIPFVVPHSWSTNKIGNAIVAAGGFEDKEWASKRGWNGRNFANDKVSLAEEIFGTMGLMKFRSLYPDTELTSRFNKLEGAKKDASKEITKVANRFTSTSADLDKIIKDTDEILNWSDSETNRLAKLRAQAGKRRSRE